MARASAGLSKSDFSATLLSRFSRYCGRPADGDCIEWTGTRTRKGYGVIRFSPSGEKTTAHRVAWVIRNGHIPPGLMVLHRCDNPRCVNADHLFLGSAKDNTADMVSKRRHPWRNWTPWQKLGASDGERVRDLRKAGCTQQEISDWLHVSRPLISMILAGKINHSARLQTQ